MWRWRSRPSRAIGLAVTASQIRAGLIACTGNAGCKFAASDTKRHAAAIGDWCEPRVEIDTPLNIHLTGCHHSCAQHYISDIGLIAAKVPGRRRGRHRRGLSSVRRRRLRSGCRYRAGGLSRPQGRGRAEDGGETVEGLSRQSRLARAKPFSPSRAATTAKPCANSPMRRHPHEPDDASAENRNHSRQRAVLRKRSAPG